MIYRPLYVDKIMAFTDTPFVKILTGVRRCGKSTILKMIMEKLNGRGVPSERIISYRFDSMEYEDMTAKQFYADIKSRLAPNAKTYLFLDEVQEINGWEKIVNSLSSDFNVDIYVTGSNSRMMSSEISTYLTGRYITFKIYTLVRDIYHSTVFSDIVKRNQVRKVDQLERVIKYTFGNVGNTFSAKSISDYLKAEKRTLDHETVYSYLEKLEKAYLLHRCSRYDMQGKEVLKTQEKFYLADTALRYSVLGYNADTVAASLENVVYLELCRRGYTVKFVKAGFGVIDFVATRQN